MASNRRTLKAYVRYDGTGRVLPGGPILSRFKPKVGNWVEIDAYECCNPTTSCSGGPFWINYNSQMDDEGGYDATNSAIDSSCNVYTAYYYGYDSEGNVFISYLQKFDKDGNLLWTKQVLIPGFVIVGESLFTTNAEVRNLRVGSDNMVYVCFNSAVFKFDSDGNVVWSKIQGIDDFVNTVIFEGLALDSNNNVFIQGMAEPHEFEIYELYYCAKISSSGTILLEKTYNDVRQYNFDIYGPGYCDESGNFYGHYEYNLSGWTSTLIKFDSNLNVLWTKEVNYPSGEGCDQDMTAVRVLSDGSPIHTSYEGGVYRYTSSGGFTWFSEIVNPGTCYSFTSIAVDKRTDDIYFVGTDIIDNSDICIVKLDKNGIYQWAYNIQPAPLASGFTLWDMMSDNAEIQNDVLVISSNTYVLKLPLSQLTPGMYAGYLITDVTSSIGFTQSTPTLNDIPLVELPTSLLSANLVTPTVLTLDTTFTVTKISL